MKNPARLFLVSLIALSLDLALAQTTKPTDPAQAVTPGYTVVTEITFDEQGVPESAAIVESDDPTGDHYLEQMVTSLSAKETEKQPPRLKDGKPVKFKARRPFHFPVEGDQGLAANANRPKLSAGDHAIPKYPDSLKGTGETGGAIVELTIRADGLVKSVRTLRASHQEFARAAEAALGQWTFNPDTRIGAPAETRWNVAIGFTSGGRELDLKWRLAPRPSIGGFIVGHLPPAAPAPASAPAQAPAAAPAAPTEKK
jgi:TonB family protein